MYLGWDRSVLLDHTLGVLIMTDPFFSYFDFISIPYNMLGSALLLLYAVTILAVSILITCLMEWGLAHFKVGIYDPSKNTPLVLKAGISVIVILTICALAFSQYLSILTYGNKALTGIMTNNDYSTAVQLMDIYEDPEYANKKLLFSDLTYKDIIELTFFPRYAAACAKVDHWFVYESCQSDRINAVYFKMLHPDVIKSSRERLLLLVDEYPRMSFKATHLSTEAFEVRYNVDNGMREYDDVYQGLKLLVNDSNWILNRQPYAAALVINTAVSVLNKRKEDKFKALIDKFDSDFGPELVPRALAGYDAYYKTLVNLCYRSKAPMDCSQLNTDYKQYVKSIKEATKAWKAAQRARAALQARAS
jgi:hypothetical protein